MTYCPYCGNKIDSTSGNCACGWMPQSVDGEGQYWSHAPLFAATPALVSDGLTKRELFAAMMCAADTAGSEGYVLEASRAEWAVKQADALIAALNHSGDATKKGDCDARG